MTGCLGATFKDVPIAATVVIIVVVVVVVVELFCVFVCLRLFALARVLLTMALALARVLLTMALALARVVF